MKRLSKIVTIVFFAFMFSVTASSEQVRRHSEEYWKKHIEYYYNSTEEEWLEYKKEMLSVDGSAERLISEEFQDCFKKQKNMVLSIEYKDIEQFKNEDFYKTWFRFYFVLKDGTQYEVNCDAYVKTCYTIKELIKLSGIQNSEDVVFVFLQYPPFEGIDIVGYDFTPYKNGWNEIDNKQYYIKSDGTMITKSCKIGGIRYKFTSDGVCKGKYTGWTKSSKGRRYWKDGILITNRYLRTKSGVRYFADENGYVRVCD